MALLIAQSQPDIPDYNHEIHTVIIDNIFTEPNHTNNTDTDFVMHLPTPLENVVQARLVAATFRTSSSGSARAQRALHIGIEELRTHFSQRGQAEINYPGDSATDLIVDSANHLNGIFGTVIGPCVAQEPVGDATPVNTVITFKDEYPIVQCFHNPIRRLDRLTFNIDKETGATAEISNSVMIFRFTCRKKNLA
jgi:hypothetical protein